MTELQKEQGITYGSFDMCCFGARDPVSKKLILKPTSLLHNFPPGVLDPVFRRCSNRYCQNKHEHEHLEGSAKGHGSRTHLAQVYPYRLCQALADCFSKFFNVRPSDRCTSLYMDLLDDFSDKECQSLSAVFQSYIEQDFLNVTTVNVKDQLFDTKVTSTIVEDSRFARMSRAIAQVSNTCELDVNSQNYGDSRIQAIGRLYLSSQHVSAALLF